QSHPDEGAALVRAMGLDEAVAQHHEAADGSGFPHGHAAEALTPAAHVLALINRYDRLCNPHHPAKALTPHEACSPTPWAFIEGDMGSVSSRKITSCFCISSWTATPYPAISELT
ncbi:hypothetical protein H4F37_24045, partial [Escherichia coli]|nr:hypothetical protein [Escherichia coli]